MDTGTPIAPENQSHLFIGDQTALQDHTISYIQKKLCPHNSCSVCITCRSIRNKQHHALQWLYPEKGYTRDELAPIFHTLSFALDTHEQFFIVIEKADYLTSACANSLLKSLEEPPAGYYFLLLTDRMDQLLPTIRSRCTIHTIKATYTPTSHDALFNLFTTTSFTDPAAFLKILDKEKPTEQRSTALLDQLLTHWIELYKKNLEIGNVPSQKSPHNNSIEPVIATLQAAIKYPPMPGSSKIMWKNLFLQIKKQVPIT